MDFPTINFLIVSRMLEDITYGILLGVLFTLTLLIIQKVGRRNIITDFA